MAGLFKFGTKAETLDALHGKLRSALLCGQFVFTVRQWNSEREALLDEVHQRWGSRDLVVRSSATHEDGATASMAGSFLSVVGVPADDAGELRDSIEAVIRSYGRSVDEDQILVQPQIKDVVLSGVAMSRDLSTGAPYFVINYDDFSGRTDTVTAGAESKTVMVLRSAPTHAVHSTRIASVIAALTDLETVTGNDKLDVEFCVTADGDLYVLQARRMAMGRHWHDNVADGVERAVSEVRGTVGTLMQQARGLVGRTTLLGQMPDWNPAEMIGSAPTALAYSLYDQLITSQAWATARKAMGYRDVSEWGLMHSLAGRPYIDVRLSLNSMLPAALDDEIADKLIDHQLQRLAENRELHDKIEFDIAIPSLDLDFERHHAVLAKTGLSSEQIQALERSLLALTDRFVSGYEAHFEALLQSTLKLDRSRASWQEQPWPEGLRSAIAACREQGIVPFAQLARHAFVAMSFVRSLLRRQLLSESEAQALLGSVRTVAVSFVEDLQALAQSRLSPEAFLGEYGHLRPGTYNIASLRYDEMPLAALTRTSGRHQHGADWAATGALRSHISARLEQVGFSFDAEQLFGYIREAVRARELSKFLFTRTVSDMLQYISDWGAARGLEREELAHLGVESLLRIDDEAELERILESNRERHAVALATRLPPLIAEPDDVDVVRIPIGHPTFITNKHVIAPGSYVDAATELSLASKVVLIRSADPGYDWVFAHDIAGLITEFGGANSHMAIRCAEFGIPAAIGCGERLFAQALSHDHVELDCAAATLRFPSLN